MRRAPTTCRRRRLRLVAAAPPDVRAAVARLAGELPGALDAERRRRMADDVAHVQRAAGGPDADGHQPADVPVVAARRRAGRPAGSPSPDPVDADADAAGELRAGGADARRRHL